MDLPQNDSLIDLSDAIARGRLCLAEVADIMPNELNALYEAGLVRLSRGQPTEAVTLLRALSLLFPYSARYWRGLGVALHRCGQLAQAAAAYEAALLLEPDHGLTLCYAGEVQVQLGREASGLALLAEAAASADSEAAHRAGLLVQALRGGTSEVTESEGTGALAPASDASSAVTSPHFTLIDGRALPLEPSRFSRGERTDKGPTPGAATERIFAGGKPNPLRDTTDTAIVARPGKVQTREPLHPENSGTLTAKVDRKRLQPPPAQVLPTAARRRRLGQPLTEEVTLTHVYSDHDTYEGSP